MADDVDAISILITAEDQYTSKLRELDEETRQTILDQEEIVKSMRDVQKQHEADLLGMIELINDIEAKKKHASGVELENLIKIQEEYKRYKEVALENLDVITKELVEHDKALSNLYEASKERNDNYIKDEKKRSNQTTEGLWNIRRGGMMARQGITGLQKAIGGIGSGFAKAGGSAKKFGSANAAAFDSMRQDGSELMGVLNEIAGIDYGATIQGLTGVSEQLEMMKKLQAQGKGISGMMKLNLALTGLQAIEPLVKGIVNYFTEAEAMAKLSAAVSAQTKELTKSQIQFDKDRISMAKEMIAVMGDTEEAQQLENETAKETSERLKRIQREIDALDEKQENYFLGKSLFHAEEIKNDNERLESLKEQQKALLELSSIDVKRQQHLERMKQLNIAKSYRDQAKALEEQNHFLRIQNRQNATDFEMTIKKMRAKMIADGQNIEQVEKMTALMREQKQLQEEIAAKQSGESQDYYQEGKTPFDKLMEERDKHLINHEKHMQKYEETLKRQFMTTKELRTEELKRLGLNPRMIKGIVAQEEAMRKLKEAGPDPEQDVQAGNVSRLSGGQTTEKMTEAERKTLEHQKRMEKFAQDQLEAFKKAKGQTIEFQTYTARGLG